MKKTYNFCLSIFTLMLLQILYYLWQPHPKSILKTAGSPWLWSDAITGIIYILLFAAALNIGVRSILNPGEPFKFFTMETLKYIALVFAVQIFLDLVKLGGIKLLPEYSALIYDVSTLIFWCLFAWLISKMFGERTAINKYAIIAISAAIIALLICLGFDICDIARKRHLIEKYNAASTILESKLINIQFRFEIRNMCLDFFCGSVCLYFFLQTGSEKSKSIEKSHGEGSRMVFRMIALMGALLIIYAAKVLVLPYNAVLLTYIGNYGTRLEYRLAEKVYDISYSDTDFVARVNEQGEGLVYRSTECTVWYNGNDLFSFEIDGHYTGNAGASIDELLVNGWQALQIGSADVAIFASQEIVWVDNEEVEQFSFKDIPAAVENETLTSLCMERIAAGDWRFFEYGYEYLLKYAPDFIEPYIEYYARGDFSADELKYNEEYNPVYIQDIAIAASLSQS